MRNVKFCLLYLVILLVSSCKTPAIYFGRPEISPVLLNGDGSGYQDGILIGDTTNYIAVSPDDYEVMLDYYDDKEFRLMICLKYTKRCQ